MQRLHGGGAAAGPWEMGRGGGSPLGGRGWAGYEPGKWLEGRPGGGHRGEVCSRIMEGLVYALRHLRAESAMGCVTLRSLVCRFLFVKSGMTMTASWSYLL